MINGQPLAVTSQFQHAQQWYQSFGTRGFRGWDIYMERRDFIAHGCISWLMLLQPLQNADDVLILWDSVKLDEILGAF